MVNKEQGWNIWVDTGGTFTDCLGVDPSGNWHRTKVLSSSGLRGTVSRVLSGQEIKIRTEWDAPDNFVDGFKFLLLGKKGYTAEVKYFNGQESTIEFTEAIANDGWNGQSFEVISPEESPVLAARLVTKTPVGKSMPPMNLRLATTRGTNALLERKGAETVLFITKGFGDLMKIGNQQRPDLFSLKIDKPEPLYKQVLEVDERIDAEGRVLKSITFSNIEKQARELVNNGIKSAAIVLMNSYANPEHEQELKRWLRGIGFEHVSVSSELSRFIKVLPRAETTVANAYLSLVMEDYLDDVNKKVEQSRLLVMTSAGGLLHRSKFTAKDGLLSGPAAGVVGAATAGKQAGFNKTIAFDMGGTSTDVSRYDGDYEYIFEHQVGNAHLMAPAVAVETVAAGGGSICFFDGHQLRVGPESAGASPGPACYGAGGPLTLTDVNVVAGRLDERNFHIPIDKAAARKKIKDVADEIIKKESKPISLEKVVEGFLDIANQRMTEAIEKISLRKGYDPHEYALVSFGGAGGQHCCAMAQQLGISSIVIPKDAGLLSAFGLGHAVLEHFEEEQVLQSLSEIGLKLPGIIERLIEKARGSLSQEAPAEDLVVRRKLLFLRLKGQESTLEVAYEPGIDIAQSFRRAYQNRYGHWVDDAVVEVESIRVVVSTQPEIGKGAEPRDNGLTGWKKLDDKHILFNGEKILTPVYNRNDANLGGNIAGPALILDPYSTILVEPGWRAEIDENGSLVLSQQKRTDEIIKKDRPETVERELFTHRFTSIAEKMGGMLQRTALSVNVKERLDFSCALLNTKGELVVNAPHIPVHLGALGICVRSLMKNIDMKPGDVIVTNHPAYGGSHLPDVTVVTPVYDAGEQLIGFTANRAHHAEIGGLRPGSMPPNATSLAQEGVVISPMHLLKKGEPRFDQIKKHLLEAEFPTRNIDENIADLQAQVAANQHGAVALRNLAKRHGVRQVQYYMDTIKDQAAQLMLQTIKKIPNGKYQSKELLDDNTPICVQWKIEDEFVTIDFEGTGPVHPRNLNATPAIVNSVVMYVLRVLIGQPIPLNEGLLKAVQLQLPHGLLNPRFSDDPRESPAVVGGNVEISQRLTDTLLKPFEKIACGQGTMNNILFGNDAFGYYETVGGGSGAGPDFDGADGVHQHMTNTRGTDPEIFEQRYPVRLDRYAIRKKSGGTGKHKGGNGIIREMTFLEPVELSVLTQHRTQAPYGQKGGAPGKTGKQWVVRKDGEKRNLAPSDSCDLEAGDRFILLTPGGGGFGRSEIQHETEE